MSWRNRLAMSFSPSWVNASKQTSDLAHTNQKNMRDGESKTIYELLKARAEHAPEAVAILAPGKSDLTFRGLLRQVDSVVGSLRVRGVQSSDRVAVVLPNGPDMAVTFLGVAASAICAPLNPAYSKSEFEFCLTDLKPKALIVQAGIDSPAIAVVEERGIPVIELLPTPESAAGVFALSDSRQPLASDFSFPEAGSIALLLHTSGTTSRPKMVPLTQGNLLASAGNIAATLRLTQSDRCLNVMPLFHIHGLVGALLSSVMAGGGVICASGLDSEHFFSWIEVYRPTWYTAVPTMHHAVLSLAQAQPTALTRHSLRFVRSSSAALPVRVMHELEETFKVPVIESYGMTEAAHQMASNPLSPGQRKAGSVGLAAGPEVSIMDESGGLVSTGDIGEIVIRGANVMHDYMGNGDANAKAYTQGWFRTGDQGYLDGDAYLFLTGRIKELINRGGEKISPREIDDVLLAHPAVEQAATFAVPHPTLGEEVAAAVVLRPHRHATAAELGEFVTTRVADFKTPKQIIIVDEIPRSATGKLQRVDLAERLANHMRAAARSPETQLESMLAGIYAEVLGVEAVGATDNFFALGGDSLSATQVIARVRAALDVNLSIATVFRKPTVTELAAEIVRVMAETDEGSIVA